MKKLILLFMFVLIAPLYGVQIVRMSKLDFGEVVQGDRYVRLTNVRVYVKGEPDEDVKIYFPETFDTEAGQIVMTARQKKIKLSGDGKGRFVLDCKLNLDRGKSGGHVVNRIPISVTRR